MTWRTWLPRLTWKASSTARALLMQTVPGVPVWTPRDYSVFAREGYSSSAIVYACVNVRARAMAGLHWLVQQKRGGRWRELDEHPVLALLQRPNPLQSGAKFFETLTGYQLISGNSYIERVGPGTGEGRVVRPPRELYALRPDRVTVVPGSTVALIDRYEYRAGGEVTLLPAPLVLHSKFFDPTNDWYGLSPLQVLAKAVDTDNIAIAWNYSLIKKGARPSGALVVQKNLTDAQYMRLQKQIDDQVGDAVAGQPMLLEGGMDWKEMALSPKDMDWLESRKVTKSDIAMAYGVPGELVGLKENTYENRREAKKALYTETILPDADTLRDGLNAWLLPLYGDRIRLDYDRDAIDALQEDRQKVWERVQKADWLTVNEKRAATGYDERPDGDVLLVPFSLTPLAQVGDTGTDFAQLPTDGAPKSLAIKATDTAREREWTARVRQFLPIEQRYQKALASYFNAQRDEVLRRLDRSSIGHMQRTAAGPAQSKAVDEILFELDEQTGKLREVSRPYFDEAVARGGEAVWAEVGASGSFSPAAPETRIQIDYQLRQLSGVTERVRQRIEQEIAAGLSADESPAEIAARINRLYAGTAGAKAATIARTEVARAYNETRWTAMRQLGIETAEWLTARDEAVREAHAIDGEVQRLGVPFSNGLRFPHDPTGAAGNVINCRCVAIPVARS